MALLTLPQTDSAEDALPQGEERSEKFVLEVSEYFSLLDASQSFSIRDNTIKSAF